MSGRPATAASFVVQLVRLVVVVENAGYEGERESNIHPCGVRLLPPLAAAAARTDAAPARPLASRAPPTRGRYRSVRSFVRFGGEAGTRSAPAELFGSVAS
jgi:hypothetical protein